MYEEDTITNEDKIYYQRLHDLSFNNLVLSSGGMNGILTIGALHFLYSNGKLEGIKNYVGCSIGSLICLLLLVGYTPFEMINEIVEVNKDNELMSINISNILKNFGIYNNNIIKSVFESLVLKKLEFIPTLKELYEMTEKTLTVTVFNYTKFKLEYIDHTTNPSYLCTDIVSASCSIPIIFNPVVIDNIKYIDGGIIEPFPINYAQKFIGNTLGIVILYNPNEDYGDNISLAGYISHILFLPTTIQKHNSYKKYLENENVCIINVGNSDSSGVSFKMDKIQKLKIFSQGDSIVKKKYNKLLNKSQ